MARLGGILPPFLRSPLTGGTVTVGDLEVGVVNDMPDVEIVTPTIDVEVPGLITQVGLTNVIDAIGDVVDDFLLDESGPPVVSRISGVEMEVDFGAGGDTLVYGEAAVAPDEGTSIRNPATAGAGSFGAVLQHEDALTVSGLEAFTIVFWYRAMAGGSTKLRTLAGEPQTWAIGSDNTNKLSWGLATDEVAYSQCYSDGTWFDDTQIGVDQMFAGVYDGTEQRVYRNAVLDGTLPKTGAVITSPPGTLSVLTNNLVGFGAQAHMYGNLDRVVLFSKALTPADLQALYAASRTLNYGQIEVEIEL